MNVRKDYWVYKDIRSSEYVTDKSLETVRFMTYDSIRNRHFMSFNGMGICDKAMINNEEILNFQAIERFIV